MTAIDFDSIVDGEEPKRPDVIRPARQFRSRFAILIDGRLDELKIQPIIDAFGSCAMNDIASDGTSICGVGHQWGSTIYRRAVGQEVQRVRKLIGHTGMVTSIDFDLQKKLVLTSGTDGTICCFTLEPWKFHSELGANFRVLNGNVVVENVDEGSPSWEAGMAVGDEVQILEYAGKPIQGVQSMLEVLREFEVGENLQFRLRRPTTGEVFDVGTRCLQRPLWKFYFRDGEWILWRWQDYFYDCSTQGDTLVGWQINQGFDKMPEFLKAEQARERFYKPSKLRDFLNRIASAPERAMIPEMHPPKVAMEVDQDEEFITANVRLEKSAQDGVAQEVRQLELWINDYRYKYWRSPRPPTEELVKIPKKLLRDGTNTLVARAYSGIGVRGDSQSIEVFGETFGERKLWGLSIGVKDYSRVGRISKSRGGLEVLDLRFPVQDARSVDRLLKSQNRLFSETKTEILINEQARRDQIVRAFEQLSKVVAPNDWLVVSFSGHGHCFTGPDQQYNPESFTFITSDADVSDEVRLRDSGFPIHSVESTSLNTNRFISLFDALAQLPCRKLVLLDACHSGGASDAIRLLTPDFQIGPAILVAASKNQFAHEVGTKAHGLFTCAVEEALTSRFNDADQNKDNAIDSRELFEFCRSRVRSFSTKTR